jgi:drug/metabolite transporter (DMT)-like permease
MINNKYLVGVSLKIINLIMITIYSILLIEFGCDCDITQFCFMIVAIGAFLTLPIVLFLRIDLALSKRSFELYFLRAIFNAVGILSWVIALREIGANSTTAISYIIPFFTTIMSQVILKERFNGYSFFGLVAGILGTFAILAPVFSDNMYGIISGLISTIAWSCYDIVCKKQTEDESAMRQVFYNFLFTALILMPIGILSWKAVSLEELGEATIISMLSAVNIMVLFLAYRMLPLTILMPFSYLRLPLMSFIMHVLDEEVLTMNIVFGVMIIFIANGLIFLKQYKSNV